MIPLDHLRTLALAATPGPWALRTDICDVALVKDGLSEDESWAIAYADGDDGDMAFIAALNPQTVLALLAELEAARAVIAVARDVYAHDDVYCNDDPEIHARDRSLGFALHDYDRITTQPTEGAK